jgi:hypothetical protein
VLDRRTTGTSGVDDGAAGNARAVVQQYRRDTVARSLDADLWSPPWRKNPKSPGTAMKSPRHQHQIRCQQTAAQG